MTAPLRSTLPQTINPFGRFFKRYLPAIPDARRPRWACVENDWSQNRSRSIVAPSEVWPLFLKHVLETVRITQQRFDPAPGIALQGGERVA